MKVLLSFACSLLLLAAQAHGDSTPLTSPTVGQVDPYLATTCTNSAALSLVSATSTDPSSQTLTGEATFTSFACDLKVHAGRGGGVRYFSGCADVVWDTAGTIVSVTPRDAQAGRTLPGGC